MGGFSSIPYNPQHNDPLESVGRIMQLKGLMGQQEQAEQMRPLQLQAAQDEAKLRQDAIRDRDATNAAMRTWDGSDWNALAKSVLQNGGSADAATKIQQHGLSLRKVTSDLAKQDAETGSKNLETFIGKHKAVGDILTGIEKVPDEQLHAQTMAGLDQLVKGGVIDPQVAQQLAAGIQQTQDPKQLRQQIDVFAKSSMGAKAAAEQAKLEEDKRKTTAEANKAETEAAQLKESGGSGAMADSRYRNIVMNRQLGRPVTPEDEAFTKAYEKQKTLNTQFKFNLEAGGGGQATLTKQQQATADAIAEGRMSPPGSFALKTPYWQTVMGGVLEKDPQWNEQRAQLRKDFTVGKHSTEINAINTAMGHVGVLGDAIDALNNGDTRLLNAIGNRLGVEVGKDNVTTFRTIVHRVGPEISKAYIAAGGTAGERGTDEKDFDPDLAPKILRSNVGMTAKLLRSKISSLENQWDQNKGENMPSFQERFITPEAQKQLDKWAPQSQEGSAQTAQPAASLTVTAPNGKTYHFPNQQALDNFKKSAGIP